MGTFEPERPDKTESGFSEHSRSVNTGFASAELIYGDRGKTRMIGPRFSQLASFPRSPAGLR